MSDEEHRVGGGAFVREWLDGLTDAEWVKLYELGGPAWVAKRLSKVTA